ncbi:MAG: hypothetical protein Q9157_007874 [Trypethelium eluteriae]
MDNVHSETVFQPGDLVPFHLIPWIVILSFVASFIGTLTTVELLHRRITTGKLWLSIPGFTALSVFLPIIFLFIGFFIADRESQKHRGKVRLSVFLCIAGVAAGLSIVGMHYVGNFGILNYKLVYTPRYIGGAIVVAVVDATGSLAFFFSMKELWINRWWSRLMTAIFLAIAVSGMHWVASVGVVYRLKAVPTPNAGNARNVNLIIAVALSAVAFLACVGIVWYVHLRKRQLAARAQQVVLACAVFDSEGRLMVTQEGLLPSRRITKQFNNRSFDEEFDVAHPVFQWLYRVTYNWNAVLDLIPSMRINLRHYQNGKKSAKEISSSSSVWEYDGEVDYSLLFRESFCVAASDLALEMQVPIQNIGVLYDDIMMTGTMSLEARAKRTIRAASGIDLESGEQMTFGKGQLMFVVRQVSRLEVSRLTAAGYRFAAMSQVGEIIARSMQVPVAEFAAHVDRLREHCKPNDLVHRSTYLACYALRSTAAQKGFDILVPRALPCQLPKVEIPLRQVKPWQQGIFARLEGRSVRECLQYLSSKEVRFGSATEEEESFTNLMHDRISALSLEIGESWFYQAIFCSKPFRADFTDLSNDSLSQVTIYAFCIIPDVHNCSLKPLSEMTYTPLSFFKSRQRVYKNSPDHASLARNIHYEFAPIIHQIHRDMMTRSAAEHPQGNGFWNSFRRGTAGSDDTVQPDNSSERELVKAPGGLAVQEVEPAMTRNTTSCPFGGILVSSDTIVASDRGDAMLEMRNLGTTALISAEKTEKEAPTFVDHLFNVTFARFNPGHLRQGSLQAP